LLHQGNDPRSGIAEDTDIADIRTPDPGFWATTVSSPNRWCARRMSDQLVSAKVRANKPLCGETGFLERRPRRTIAVWAIHNGGSFAPFSLSNLHAALNAALGRRRRGLNSDCTRDRVGCLRQICVEMVRSDGGVDANNFNDLPRNIKAQGAFQS
jgi:hypothetical protein